jgi:hypothetical protein
VPNAESASGAAKGFYNEGVTTVEDTAQTPYWMKPIADLRLDLDGLKAPVSDGEQGGAFLGAFGFKALSLAGVGEALLGRVGQVGRLELKLERTAYDIDDTASAATTVGRRGQQGTFPNPTAPAPRNAPGTVGGRGFSGHAFDRMQERGYTPSVVENAIQHGRATPGRTPGTVQHFDEVNKFNVITDDATGSVITVF